MNDATADTLAVTGVDFVALPSNDLEASEQFYGTVLGLPFVKRWGDMPGIEFQAGNLTIAIMEPTAFGQEFRAHAVPLALAVDDVPAGSWRPGASRSSPMCSTAGSVTRRSSVIRPGTHSPCIIATPRRRRSGTIT